MTLDAVGAEAAADLGLTTAAAAIREGSGRLPWTSTLAVGRLAADCVALSSLAIDGARAARDGGGAGAIRVDLGRIAASFASERVLRIDGAEPEAWAPLSGFWPSRDGWVRTHANYPHHEHALRTVLGVPAGASREAVAGAIRERPSTDLEEQAHRAGAIVAAVRTGDAWRRHPQALAVASRPLIEVTRREGAPPRPWWRSGAPLSGVRVLDLTRVITGPVAGRDLALAGADVLRVDPPHLPETGWIHLDTGQGKRSTVLDLADGSDRDRFAGLLRTADVVLSGYRPGSLDRFGLDAASLAASHPGIVTARVSAWGETGPWANRRGFDSIVQAATGIAMRESTDGTTPGALPVQALDHSTGHLLAAAVVTALVRQRTEGGSFDVRMSLARVAQALLAAPGDTRGDASVALPSRERLLPGHRPGALVYAPPVLAFAGAPDDYPVVGGAWGADAPAWDTAP